MILKTVKLCKSFIFLYNFSVANAITYIPNKPGKKFIRKLKPTFPTKFRFHITNRIIRY